MAIEALKEQQTIVELAKRLEIHLNQIAMWKREFIENAQAAFGGDSAETDQEPGVAVDRLYQEIGQLKIENDFLKKSLIKAGL